MFSDIVGYDSLLKEDDKKAFETRKKNQRIHKRLIKRFNGRWLKEMESGTLASFSSNIDAVMCAVSIQSACKELEIPVRIGIHLGDVIFEKKDVLGDGVNIASRIQGLADPYDIVISERVYDDIKNKEGLAVQLVGERSLKGVEKPTAIYKVSCSDDKLLDFTIETGELVQPLSFGRSTLVAGIMVIALLAFALYYFLPKIINRPTEQDQSVLVLPCVNYMGTDTLDYYLAGMHDAMIGDIGKVSALRVISTTTAKTYKNTLKSIPEIAAELGVNKIIEPSVMCLGDSVCIRLKAISAYPEEKQLWVQDFKVEKSEILSLYNMVTKDIADRINVALTPQEEKLLAQSRSVDKEAYDAFLKAKFYWQQFSPESFEMARIYCEKAIEIDPDWAPPYMHMASYWRIIRPEPASITIPKIYEYFDMAKKLDSTSEEYHFGSAVLSVWTEFDWKKGEQEFLKVLELNPNESNARSTYSHLLLILKRGEEAMEQAELAVDRDPLNPMTLSFYAVVAANNGEYDKAIEVAEKALAIAPKHNVAIGALVQSYFNKGDYRSALNYMIDWNFLDEETRKLVMDTYDEKGYTLAALELARVIERSGLDDPCTVANLYALSGYHAKAMDLLEQAYKDRNMNLPYIGSSGYLNSPYRVDNPRFNELLKKMNLPVD